MKFKLSLNVFLPILCLFLTITAQGIDEGENVLKNPSFEDGLNGWEKRKSHITPQIDDSTIQGVGSSSLKIVGELGKTGYTIQRVKNKSHVDKYKLSGWMKTKNFADKWAASIWLQCAVTKEGKRDFKSFVLRTNYHLPNTEWSKFEKLIDIPQNTEYMNVLLRTRSISKTAPPNNTGTVWFDNISLEQVTPETHSENIINYISTNENILRNPNFKNSFQHWSIRRGGKFILPVLTPENIIKYSPEGNKSNIYIGKQFTGMQKGEKYRLTLEIKSDSSEKSPTISIDLSSRKEKENLVKLSNKIPTGKWEKIVKDFEVSKDFWRSAFRLDINIRGAAKDIYIKNICLERLFPVKDEAISIFRFYPLGEKGIFNREQQPELLLQVANGSEKTKNITCKISVKDFYHSITHESEHNVFLDKLSIKSTTIAIPKLKKQGFYTIQLQINNNKKLEAASSSTFCIFDRFKIRDPFFGINGSYSGSCDIAALFGVGNIELRMYWGEIAHKNGYDWKSLDEKVKAAIHNNMQIIGTFMPAHHKGHYVPSKLYYLVESNIKKKLPPFEGEYTKAWEDFVKAVVLRYKDKIKIWSIREELDAGAKSELRTENYINKVKTAYPIIKKLQPGSIVGGICMAGDDRNRNPRFPVARKYWDELHDYVDAMFEDPYLAPRVYGPGEKVTSPEAAKSREILQDMVKLVTQYGKNKVAVAEMGTAIRSEQSADSKYGWARAKALARSLIIAKSVPEVMFYSWFYALGPMQGIQGGRDYGLWQNIFSFRIVAPRPSLAAYCTTARLLTGTTNPQKINLHQDLQIYVFKKENSCVAALWTTNKDSIKLSFRSPVDIESYNLMGNLVKVLPVGENSLSLSDEPLFLTIPAKQKSCVDLLSQATYSLPLVKSEIRFINKDTIGVTIVNQTSHALSASVEMGGEAANRLVTKETPVKLPGKSKETVTFKLKNTDIRQLNGKVFIANIKIGKNTFLTEKKVELYVVPKLSGKVKIDGSLSEFKNITPIVRDNADRLYPQDDAIAYKLWSGPDDLSCKVYIAYDNDYLYFAASVKDNCFSNAATGNRLFLGDSFQIAFDTLNDALDPELLGGAKGYDKNDYEYGIALTTKGAEVYCWYAAEERAEIIGTSRKIPFVVKKQKDNYINYELAIPWADLRPLSPEAGKAFGLDFVLIDNDKPGSRGIKCGQMLSGGIVGGKNPSLFKTFILGK